MQSSISRFLRAIPKIYCLSLESSVERRAYINSFINQYDLDNVEVVDACTPEHEEVRSLYSESRVHTFPNCFRCGKLECGNYDCNNTLIPPQVATFASYIKVFRAFLAGADEYALFVEDDIKLSENAETLCKQAISSDWVNVSNLNTPEAALVQLGWALCDDHSSNEQFTLSRFSGKMANPAFALNKAMARRILKQFSKVDTTADIFVHRICANDSNAKTFYPPLFYEMSWSTGEVDSTIHPKEIRVEYLRSHGSSPEELKGATEKLTTHNKHTSVHSLLVIGHPRCGSGYSAKLCQAAGVNIGHEELLDDGISSWMFATYDECPWALNEGAKTRQFKYFKRIVMHVRDPRTAIPSIMRDNKHSEASYQFRRKHILKHFYIDIAKTGDDFTQAVASYIYWNKLVLEQGPDIVFRVEDEGDKLVSFLAGIADGIHEGDVNYPSKDVNANKKYNGKLVGKPNIEVVRFSKLPANMLTELNMLCEKFGYSTFAMMKPFNKEKFLEKVEALTLKPTGWLRSAEEEISVDSDGAPTPWWTMPAIEFMNSVLSKHWRVFEYGCGNSTLWWQNLVSQVVGVDHNADWVSKISPHLRGLNKVILKGEGSQIRDSAQQLASKYLDSLRKTDFDYDSDKMTRRGLNDEDFIDYADAINQVGGKFNCIVIDGMARRLCAHFAVDRLTDDGVIVFDNSNRSDYIEGYQYLVENGFYQIRFSGPVAGAPFPSCTSIFVKSLSSFPKVVFEPSLFKIPEY